MSIDVNFIKQLANDIPSGKYLPKGVYPLQPLPVVVGKPTSIEEYVIINQTRLRGDSRAVSKDALSTFKQKLGPDAFAAVELGLQFSETGQNIGQAAGPKGQIVGAVVGFLGGLVLGLFPFERQAALDNWRAVCVAMSPVERYLVFGAVQPIVQRAIAQERAVLDTRFRWATDPPFGHTIWGGPIANTVFLLEILMSYPCLPPLTLDNEPQKSVLALYCLCFASGAHDDAKKPRDMRHLWPLIQNGTTYPGLQSQMTAMQDTYLGTLRTQLLALGVPNIWRPLVTPSIKSAGNLP